MSASLSLANVRTLFPVCDEHVYLNNAGVAPTSVTVRAAVNRFLDDLVAHGLGHEPAWEAETARIRSTAARLLGAGDDEVAFVRNTSHGLGLVAAGLDWKEGDEVAVCAAVEYPSNVYPWLDLARRGVALRPIAPVRGGVTVDAVAEALTPRTRLVSVSAVQYATGHRTDLAAIGALCRERGVLLCVDGIQQVGALPLDVKAAGVHFLSADSHKWMLGLLGVGIFYVDRDVLPRLHPPLVGWKSTTDAWNFDRIHHELRPDAQKLEEGSPAYPMIYGLGAALEILEAVGLDDGAAHIEKLLALAEAGARSRGYAVGPEPSERAGILMLSPPEGVDPAAVERRCNDAGISVSVRRGRLRVSPHVYNDANDVEALLAHL